MPGTVVRSAAASYAVMRQLPDVQTAIDKIVEVLDGNLNLVIEEANEALTAAGKPAIRKVDKVREAPAKIKDSFVNQALVGEATEFITRIGGLIEGETVITVYIIDEPITNDKRVQADRRRRLAVMAVLEQFSGGFVDSDGNYLWNSLIPLRAEFLPELWENYAGTAVSFKLGQFGCGELYLPAP